MPVCADGRRKSFQAIELFLWAQVAGKRCAFYVNRKLLVGQTAARFGDAGLDHGVRAADHDDLRDEHASVQVCSSDTEIARVYRSGIWPLFRADLVVVDEARIQKGAKMGRILKDMPLHEGGWFQKVHSLPAEDLRMDSPKTEGTTNA